MSLCVGLGASQADLDVQGEIDFDFFEESDSIHSASLLNASPEKSVGMQSSHCASEMSLCDNHPKEPDPNVLEPSPGQCFTKPLITVSCDDFTGLVQKTTIETIIPTPFDYKDNKCGNLARKNKRMSSPRLKSKIFSDDQDVSDDSSLSSMSESESDLSSVTDDSVDLDEESDSMTDVTPMMSPYQCYSPIPGLGKRDLSSHKSSPTKHFPKEGVKLPDNLKNTECSKCQAIDINELLKAVKRLEVGQNINSAPHPESAPPSVVTQNLKCRKNLSFSNEEVRRIDNDNQVLLKKIVAQKKRSKPCSNATVRVASSASVNRQRSRRLIELENLALLKRLESTKASKELRRNTLLREYECRSAGVLSRTSSRAAKTASSRTSVFSSGRSSAVSHKSTSPSALSSTTT